MRGKTVGLKASGPNNGALTMHRRFRLCLQASVLALACAGIAGPALAQSRFDGGWSVVITTRGGACDSGVRYGVQIINGRVTSAGEGGVDVGGRVAPNGAVSVAVRSGGQWANGSGRLSMTHGGGVWRGQGNSGFCQGIWVAQRMAPQSAAAEEPRGPIYDYAPPRYHRAVPPGPMYDYAPRPRYYLPPGSQW